MMQGGGQHCPTLFYTCLLGSLYIKRIRPTAVTLQENLLSALKIFVMHNFLCRNTIFLAETDVQTHNVNYRIIKIGEDV